MPFMNIENPILIIVSWFLSFLSCSLNKYFVFYIFFFFLFQRDLNSVAVTWNYHQIRPTKNQNVPHGRPEVLYSMPDIYSTKNYIVSVHTTDVNLCKEECLFREVCTKNPEFFELFTLYMIEYNLRLPGNPQEGLDLYQLLRSLTRHDLNLI